MRLPDFKYQFPKQKVSAAEKAKPYWYANSIDYVISLGTALNDREDVETKLRILHGDIPDEFYRKILNPYNSDKEKYKRFPATMRNLDIMSDIVRRYIGEYFKGAHEFIVGANNPDVVLNRDAKLKAKIMQKAQEAFAQEFEQKYQEAIEQAQGQGQSPDTIDPQSIMPDPEEFMKKFNEDYIDDESEQAQQVLDYVRAMTKDANIYLTCFFNYCALGECYSYAEIRDNKIIKESVPVVEAYPIPNNNQFVEDHDMFARKLMMSYNQILDMFDDYLTSEDKAYLDAHYDINGGVPKSVTYEQFFKSYANVCDKFSEEERKLFRSGEISPYLGNNNLYEVWHVVWKGYAKQGILKRINEVGFEEEMIVDETYQLDEANGDISIEWAYKPQVYEGYRIGNRYTAIYPIKARPIAFQRDGKLPYNGVQEVLPFMGKFEIIKLITPFQVFRNIIAYHQEMVMAKNKMLILMLPKSLMGDNAEDTIYRMAADGTLLVDDELDAAGTKMQNVRLLNANMGTYISELETLKDSIKNDAREIVDMNAQRYGQISQSSGASTTQTAISQSSTGSVIIFQTFDEFRRTDYDRDLDYAKLAFIDGLDTSFNDALGKRQYISLDMNSFIGSDLSTTVRNNAKDTDKFEQLKQWAFSAAQNGDLESALAAIEGNNIAAIAKNIREFAEIKRQHEEQMQQVDQQIKEQANQFELEKIRVKGEEDRKTAALKAQYEEQAKYVDLFNEQLNNDNPNDDELAKSNLVRMQEENKRAIEQSKLMLERQKMAMDAYNAAADRQVKREQMKNDLTIARTNKNRYDK